MPGTLLGAEDINMAILEPLPQGTSERVFPGGLVVRIWCFHCGGPGSFPGQGTILHATRCGQNNKKKKNPKLQRVLSHTPVYVTT